jgi:hypothetical protein
MSLQCPVNRAIAEPVIDKDLQIKPVDEYIEKPIEPQVLLEKIEKLLAKQNAG